MSIKTNFYLFQKCQIVIVKMIESKTETENSVLKKHAMAAQKMNENGAYHRRAMQTELDSKIDANGIMHHHNGSITMTIDEEMGEILEEVVKDGRISSVNLTIATWIDHAIQKDREIVMSTNETEVATETDAHRQEIQIGVNDSDRLFDRIRFDATKTKMISRIFGTMAKNPIGMTGMNAMQKMVRPIGENSTTKSLTMKILNGAKRLM